MEIDDWEASGSVIGVQSFLLFFIIGLRASEEAIIDYTVIPNSMQSVASDYAGTLGMWQVLVSANVDFREQTENKWTSRWTLALGVNLHWGSTYTGVSECVIVFVDYGDGKSDILVDLLQLQIHITGLDLSPEMDKKEQKTFSIRVSMLENTLKHV